MKIKEQIQELREQIARLTMHLVNKNEVLREHRYEIASLKEENKLLRACVDETRLKVLALFLKQDIHHPVYSHDFETLYHSIGDYFFSPIMADNVYPALFVVQDLAHKNICIHALYEQMKDNERTLEDARIIEIIEKASQYRATQNQQGKNDEE